MSPSSALLCCRDYVPNSLFTVQARTDKQTNGRTKSIALAIPGKTTNLAPGVLSMNHTSENHLRKIIKAYIIL